MAVDLEARARAVRERAAAYAAELSAVAGDETTLACERAVLRLIGVTGLDRSGRPLAVEVVDRLAALGPARLGGGIGLPFAVAAREYDLEPAALALDIAAGHVDLALEAELLGEPERRREAEATLAAWLGNAWERFDANRTARAELRAVIGDVTGPSLGIDLPLSAAGPAALAAADAIAAGADLVRVRVPADRELRRRLGDEPDPEDPTDDPELAPAGSQRGLGLLRAAVDEAAAERGSYVRLATQSIGLASPDQAVVAAFERVDLVFADPLETVVEFGIEPARAVADHVFAARLMARAGVDLAVGPGPLAMAPEVARGEPLEVADRIGRSLALQAIGVELSRGAGVADDRLVLGALAGGDLGAPLAFMPGLVEVGLRRLLYPGLRLLFVEPEDSDADPAWPLALPTWLAGADDAVVAIRRPATAGITTARHEIRQAVAAAAALTRSRIVGHLTGEAAALAERSLIVASDTLRDLADDGWERLLLSPAALARRSDPSGGWIGGAGRVARRDGPDIFAATAAAR